MRNFVIASLVLWLAACTTPIAPPAPIALGQRADFVTLAYPHIVDNNPEQRADIMTVDDLTTQLVYLQAAHYNIVSLDQVLAAAQGKAVLPPHAVLLTFNGSFATFYTRVYPILQAYHLPAVLAVAPDILNQDQTKSFGANALPRAAFLTWPQVAEIARTRLITLAVDAQGATRVNAKTLEALANDVTRHTGKTVSAFVWPYANNTNAAYALGRMVHSPVTLAPQAPVATANNIRLRHQQDDLVKNFPMVGIMTPRFSFDSRMYLP